MDASPESILLIRLKSIGDILFTLPAVHLVRENYPRAKITFLTAEEHEPILRGFADVDEVLTLDRMVYRSKNLKAIIDTTIALLRRLHRERFSCAIDFQGYGETALLTWLTRAPQRWGSVYRSTRRWAYTRGLNRHDEVHPADWNLSLLQQCGLRSAPVRNEFFLPEHNLEAARAALCGCGCDPARPTLYLQPFTSSPHKNWPLEKYLLLGRFWRERAIQVIFGGGPGDRAALEPARTAGFTILGDIPKTTDMGLMKLSTLIVGGDTGFLHLAVALGKRVIMLMKPAGSGSAIPFGHSDWVIAPRNGLPLATIEVNEVVRVATSVFGERGVGHPIT